MLMQYTFRIYLYYILVYIYTVISSLSEQLVTNKACSDCETCGLLNHFKQKMIEAIIRKCVRIVRYTDERSAD